jgi:prepilin-type N-terminal cleavage/methylation domain-containing protein
MLQELKMTFSVAEVKRRAGFTFAELMIAIAILGIVAAIAIPQLSEYLPRSRVNGAARELFTELQVSKMRAISENNNYVITFNTSNNTFKIHDDDNSNGTEDTGESVKTVDIEERYPGIGYGYITGTYNTSGSALISKPVTFSGTPPSLTFKPTGLSKAGAAYLIPTAETSEKDRQRAITSAITGRVRLYRHTGTEWE